MARALCNQVHYCIIQVCHIKRRKLSWACHNCFNGTLPFYRCGLISKSAITTYCTLKCALSDLMHCFRSIWLVGCYVTSNNIPSLKLITAEHCVSQLATTLLQEALIPVSGFVGISIDNTWNLNHALPPQQNN